MQMKRSMMQVFVKGSVEAVELYMKAFNAELLCAYADDNGNYMHSELKAYGQVGYVDKTKKGIDWTSFTQKYNNTILDDSLLLGYLCHLITDALWIKSMAEKYIRKYPREQRRPYQEKGYRDFYKMNALLIKDYKVSCSSLVIPSIELDEINVDLVQDVCKGLYQDFNVPLHYTSYDLELYSYDDIKCFIQESIDICANEVGALRRNASGVNPETFYVPV